MPIIKSDIGKKKNQTEVIFGSGDIGMVPCHHPNDIKIRGLVLYQEKPKPEEEWGESKPHNYGQRSDEFPGEIIQLMFPKKASVRILIEMLARVLEEWDQCYLDENEAGEPDKNPE